MIFFYIINSWFLDSKMFVVFDVNSKGDDKFISPLIDNGTYCLSFWYYLTGSSVHLVVETSTGNRLADIYNVSGKSWNQFSVTIKVQKPFQVYVKYDFTLRYCS